MRRFHSIPFSLPGSKWAMSLCVKKHLFDVLRRAQLVQDAGWISHFLGTRSSDLETVTLVLKVGSTYSPYPFLVSARVRHCIQKHSVQWYLTRTVVGSYFCAEKVCPRCCRFLSKSASRFHNGKVMFANPSRFWEELT